ncbi:MAG: toxin-antitoxin system YwqK family antitoxin [Bacteroidia bacterium]
MKKILIIIICLPLTLLSQNKTDNKGRKQGKWEVKYENSEVVRYKGSFVNDKPVGKFTYYHTNGKLMSESNYVANSNVCRTRLYDIEGVLMAYGKYVNQVKDSTWTYYSFNGGKVIGREDYQNGQRHGKKITYYENGNIYEEIPFENNVEQGTWNMYYSDGKVKVTAKYVDGNLDGKIVYYYSNGNIEVEGFYKDAVENGFWRFYDVNGRIEKEAYYKNGIPIIEGDDIQEQIKQLRDEGKL